MDQGESRPRDESRRVDGGQTRGDEVADRSAGGLYHDERAGGAAGDIERAGQSMISASSISSAGGRTGGSGRQRMNLNQLTNSERAYTRLQIPIIRKAVLRV